MPAMTLVSYQAMTTVCPTLKVPEVGAVKRKVGMAAKLNWTVLSVLVEAKFAKPRLSWTMPAAIVAMSLPVLAMPVTATS